MMMTSIICLVIFPCEFKVSRTKVKKHVYLLCKTGFKNRKVMHLPESVQNASGGICKKLVSLVASE